MKKIFITIIAILLPLLTSATDINGINFDLDSSTKTATVVQGSYSGYIYIYSYVTYEGVTYTVTSIGENAFRNSDITDVWIPNTVTSIGKCSFGACSSLNYITIPGSVTEIGPAAFYGCSALKNVILPSGLKQIDENLFWGCTSLTSVTIPAGVTKIAEEAFRECLVLPSINIPSSVIEIGDRAFEDCTSLKSIFSEIQTPFAIPDNVFNGIPSDATLTVLKGTKTAYQNTAGWSVISDGTTEIQTKRTIHVATAGTLPQLISAEEKYYIEELTLTGELNGTDFKLIREMAGVIAIECDDSGSGDDLLHRWAEYNPTQGLLTSLNLADSRIVSGGAVYDYEGGGKSPDYYYTVSDAISPYLFSRTNIESIILPNSITSIGTCVFYNCSSLTSVTIPNSVISIDGGAFGGSSLTSIQVESGNNKYDSPINCNAIIEKSTNTLIAGCKNTIIPTSVISIGDNSFSYCSGLTSITIPTSVTSIGSYAFYNCTGLTSVTIPNSVTSIGSYAFQSCTGLTSVNISDLAAWCNIKFDGYNSNPLCYTHHLYINGNEITNLVIPNDVTSIGDYAFSDCSGLTSVAIPNSVTTIGKDAFSGCSGLTSVDISDLTAWCNIKFSGYESNPLYYAHHLYINGNEITNLVIPNDVTSIGIYAFYGCSGLTSVTIPNSVTSIGYSAFRDCSGLTAVNISDLTVWCNIIFDGYNSNPLCYAHHLYINGNEITNLVIPNDVTSIGSYAFDGCSGLTAVTIPNSVTSISQSAFSGCSGLTSITIGNSVESIGYNAFSGCSGLKSVTSLNPVPPSITGTSFGSVYEKAALNIPRGSKKAYMNADFWKLFKTIYEVGDINGDGKIDSSDIKEIENYIMGNPSPYFDVKKADINNDGVVNVADIVFIINKTKKNSDEDDNYLTFVAIDDGQFSFTDNHNGNKVKYSLDEGSTWSTLDNGAYSPTVYAGQKIMWKGELESQTIYGVGRFSSTGKFNIEGNIMSLLFGDNFENQTILAGYHGAFGGLFCNTRVVDASRLCLPATTLEHDCYSLLFQGCTNLIAVPSLPATTLKLQCYMQMFDGCTSLTTAPELPATTLAKGCYNSMFSGCTSLTTAPELPATTLANGCYNGMFYDCTSLTTAPDLPATTLAVGCYYHMFSNCTSLRYIKCLATSIPSGEGCTLLWTYNVASTGTFIKASSMNDWTTGNSGIPSGWTVYDE